ncbi:MotA/TolQ/ExbB proton channel family protein [bacterium]|nr:MotA/TolQ/ExbB proton channel family protein [bacterium]
MRLIKAIFILSCWLAARADVQEMQRIPVTDIQSRIYKDWMAVPRSADLTLFWDRPSSVEGREIENLTHFEVDFTSGDGQWSSSGPRKDPSFVLKDVKIGRRCGFVVKGYQESSLIALSDTAWMTTGKLRPKGPSGPGKWLNYFPLNGRIAMALVRRGIVFDESTKAGKIAFHLIWNFGIIGVIIVVFFSIRTLRLSNVFPFKRGPALGRGFDKMYRRQIRDDFRGIVEDWTKLIVENNQHVVDLMRGKSGQSARTAAPGPDEIRKENIAYWNQNGVLKIRDLLQRMKDRDLDRYPTGKIIRAGLENHELGGFRWPEVSAEVDHAVENRALSEQEALRRKSLIDWLWNLGTLAPLVGLFGTVTGISHAFSQLTMLTSEITQTALVRRLSGGIFEALWTTILGLFVGIIFTLVYYYYQNKLSWIYSKWEEIYADISEKL